MTDLSSFSAVADTHGTAHPAKSPATASASHLNEADFLDVVRLTPLVSIDLIVTDGNRRVLLGQRRNRPAQGMWFVPGGRVMKGETLDTAFTRVVRDELGIASVQRSASRLFGVFEHHYDDNFAGVADIKTHYVVLAYSITLGGAVPIGRFVQHSGYAWLLPTEVLSRDDVHPNAKAYFR
ncbi:GDP-mannose mannosyl hydrolase [Caballeronia sordidicola]|uniref:GDP-mannose mannosyl hydrolase n=1 Tax=Caballeronia sordidicola TaxID=196367 RepID=A0A242MGP1_CABSO|nr:GDP-mannose mannosyl hydrolase [Caballeronia sordidicola]